MAACAQLLLLLLTAAGWGWWTWRLLGKPNPARNVTWLWCGLAGFSGQALLLQALIYLDLPLNRTAPWSLGAACVGVAFLAVGLRRGRRALSHGRFLEIAALLGTGLVAGLTQATGFMSMGSDRFIGAGQMDQLNYVMTAQFLVEKPYSMEWEDMGLHPWLYRPIELKRDRITQCVVLGEAAVIARTDSQRAWGATMVFFTALLAMALAGMLRVVTAMPVPWAAVAGVVGACLPAVTTIYHLGFFSQMTTLFVFPALIAVCRSRALPPGRSGMLAAALLGFLAGAYTEFFVIGAGMTVLMLIDGPGTWRDRLARAAVVVAAALVLTTGYLQFLPSFLLNQVGTSFRPDVLSGFAPEGGTWLGWGGYFSGGPAWWAIGYGLAVLAACAAGLLLLDGHRRRWWLVAGLVPLLAGLGFALQPKLPVYAFHKLCIHFAPLLAALAVTGVWLAVRRLTDGWRYVAAGIALLGGMIPLASTVARNLALMPAARLWEARARAESSPNAIYLIGGYNGYIGGWLAYFARGSRAFYQLPALTDHRVPTEMFPFRKIPAGVTLRWLDTDRQGEVMDYEPSPVVEITGAPERLMTNHQQAYVVGADTIILVRRAFGFAPAEREFSLEMGITPLPAAMPCSVEIAGPLTPSVAIRLVGPTMSRVHLRLRPGENRISLRVRSTGPDESRKDLRSDSLLILQSLSLEAVPEAKQ